MVINYTMSIENTHGTYLYAITSLSNVSCVEFLNL